MVKDRHADAQFVTNPKAKAQIHLQVFLTLAAVAGKEEPAVLSWALIDGWGFPGGREGEKPQMDGPAGAKPGQ